MIHVKTLQDADASRWDEFVRGCPSGTFFHLSPWRSVIETAFRHRTHFLYAESGSEIVGVLPLAHIKSALFGNSLISLPFCVYGGPVVATPSALEPLIAAARRLSEELGVHYLELRNRDAALEGWPSKALYVTFRKRIHGDSDENMKAVPRKQRAMIRKGMEAGLRAEVESTTDNLFSTYSESVRNLGTPVFSPDYFRLLKSTFGESCEILTITSDGRPVASVMSFYFRDEVLPYYGGGTVEARASKANDFMYWEVMRRACERGVSLYDFGRSKVGSGSFSFKKHWGFVEQPLHYQYHLVRAKAVPDLSPANPKYRLIIAGWKRLPLPIAQWCGPKISRYLG